MKQTAVDSLIKNILPFIDRSKVSDMMLQDIVAEHLAMEKEQIIKFGKIAADKWGMIPVPLENIEDTYNETFKSE